MKFSDNKPIYLQIVELMASNIISQKWAEAQRIPSVREMGVTLAVNPATVLRAYDFLSTEEVLEQRRGVGYFVSDGATAKIIENRRKEFIENTLPELFEKIDSLGFSISELSDYYRKYKGG